MGAAGVVWGFWRIYFYLRGARRSTECDGCPELTAVGICSGFARQADDFRRYEEAATAAMISRAASVRPNSVVISPVARP
jgi:hypothetical protein